MCSIKARLLKVRWRWWIHGHDAASMCTSFDGINLLILANITCVSACFGSCTYNHSNPEMQFLNPELIPQAPIDGILNALKDRKQHRQGIDVMIANHGLWLRPMFDREEAPAHDDLTNIFHSILLEGSIYSKQHRLQTKLIWKSTSSSDSDPVKWNEWRMVCP